MTRPKVEKFTAPERIYLQPCEWPEVTWCAHEIGCNECDEPDVEYVRADVVAALRQALEQNKRGQEWGPIESAPLDGTSVLITNGESVVVASYFAVADDEGVVESQWEIAPWEEGFDGDVTHWMPIPPPPSESETP